MRASLRFLKAWFGMPCWQSSMDEVERRTFAEDVHASMDLLDAMDARLRQADGGMGAVIPMERDGALLTRKSFLVPGLPGPDFTMVLRPVRDRVTNMVLTDDDYVVVTLSVLPEADTLEGLADGLSWSAYHVAHEHKHVLEWDRTGIASGASSDDPEGRNEAYYNNPGEVSAWMHHTVVMLMRTLREEVLDGRVTADALLAAYRDGRLVRNLIYGLPAQFANVLTEENMLRVGRRFGGVMHDCVAPMLQSLRDGPERTALVQQDVERTGHRM